jgi:broad specificity phosphatase PhoE
MTQTVWIARHGNRLDFVNPEWFNTAQRKYDPPLSDDGVVQARELATRLKSENIAHIFASPFVRTIQTAHEVARVLNLPIKLEAGICEWLNPHWMDETPETHPQEWLAQQYPTIDWDYQSLVNPQYPETETQLYQRNAETIKALVEKFSEDILIVGHGASVLGTAKGLVSEKLSFKVSLCSLTKVVERNNIWEIELTTDTSHLSQTEQQVRLN